MDLRTSPTPPKGEWVFSCQPIGGALQAAFIPVTAALSIALVLIRVSHGSLGIGATIVGVGLVVGVLVRTRRIGVWADSERVVVQNFWRTYELSWIDVVRVRYVSGRYRAWIFDRREGRGIGAEGVPMRHVSWETHRLASAARTPVEVDTGPAQPRHS